LNPKRLAQLICANWNVEICRGVQINKDLSLRIDPELAGKPCCVINERCSYFERILIPQVLHITHRTHPQLQQMKRGVANYETMVMKQKGNVRRCKLCKKHSPGLKPNEKFCLECKKIRKRKSDREALRRLRRKKSEPVTATI